MKTWGIIVFVVFSIDLNNILNLYEQFSVGAITTFITVANNSFSFGKVYIESYFQDHFEEDVGDQTLGRTENI